MHILLKGKNFSLEWLKNGPDAVTIEANGLRIIA